MRRTDAIAAIQVCLFLFGTAWLDRAFEHYHVPHFVAEVHKPDADALKLDDGDQPVINLTLPPLPFVPNFVSAFPQMSDRNHAAILDASPSTNVTLMLHALARRMPVLYMPPKPSAYFAEVTRTEVPKPDDGPELAHNAPIPAGDDEPLLGAIPSPGPGVSPSARHQFHVPARDTSAPAV